MEDLTHVEQYIVPFMGMNLTFNTHTIIMTWIVMAALILFAILATRKSDLIPNPVQVVAELLINAFYVIEVAFGFGS